MCLLIAVQLKHSHEGFRRHLHRAQVAHLFLTFLLLFQQLLLTGNITAVALSQHVLTHGLHRLAGDDTTANGSLNRHFEQLTGDVLLQLFTDLTGAGVGIVREEDKAEGIHDIRDF